MASTEELKAQRATLQLKLNMWSAAFVKQNGREPTRGDKARKARRCDCNAAQTPADTPALRSQSRDQTYMTSRDKLKAVEAALALAPSRTAPESAPPPVVEQQKEDSPPVRKMLPEPDELERHYNAPENQPPSACAAGDDHSTNTECRTAPSAGAGCRTAPSTEAVYGLSLIHI